MDDRLYAQDGSEPPWSATDVALRCSAAFLCAPCVL